MVTKLTGKKLSAVVIGLTLGLFSFISYAQTANWIQINDNSFPSLGNMSGINSVVEYNHVLYAAGNDSQETGYIVKYNGDNANPKWSHVDQTLSTVASPLQTLFVFQKHLIVGGSRILATYNGNDNNPSWSPIPANGLPSGYEIKKFITLNGQLVALVNQYFGDTAPIFVFNNQTNSWTSISDELVNIKVQISDIIEFHNRIYAAGGGRGAIGSVVLSYNPTIKHWKLVKNGLPNGDSQDPQMVNSSMLTLANYNDTLYAGGYNFNDFSNSAIVYAYNGNDNAPNWINKSNGIPEGIGSSEVNYLMSKNNHLYAAGVEAQANSGGNFFVSTFDKSTQSWKQFGPDIPDLGYGTPQPYILLQIVNNSLIFAGTGFNFPVMLSLTIGK